MWKVIIGLSWPRLWCFPLRSELRPFLIWFIVFFGLPRKRHERRGFAGKIYSCALTNPVAQYFGSRSHSIFLCHYPVISAIVWLVFSYSGTPPEMLLLSCLSIPATIIVSEFTYRYIELSGIKMEDALRLGCHRRSRRVWHPNEHSRSGRPGSTSKAGELTPRDADASLRHVARQSVVIIQPVTP